MYLYKIYTQIPNFKMKLALRKLVLKSLLIATSTIIFWTIFPIMYILVSPLYLYRLVVQLLAKCLHPEWIGMMSVRDAFVSEDMNHENGLTSVVSLVFILRGTPNVKEIQKSFLEKVLLEQNSRGELIYTKFKHYSEYWLGFPFWKLDQGFSLQNHVRLCEETVGKIETTEEEFLELMGPLSTKLFSPKMPPWEMLIVENYKGKNPEDSAGRFALIFRFHHTLCDGFSVVKLVVENFGGQSKEDIPRYAKHQEKKFSVYQMIYFSLFAILQYSHKHLKLLLWDYDFNPWHVPLKKLNGKWHTVMTDKIDFKHARETSKNLGVATTTVLFGAIAGGVRRYLKGAGKAEKDIPKLMRGLFSFPVRGHPINGMVNHWTFAHIILPTRLEDSAVRLRKMNQKLLALKKSPAPGLIWLFSPIHTGVPPWLVNIWGTNRITTMTLSNFPGPKKEIVFFEKWPIEDTMFFLPRLRGSASIYVAILTYQDVIRITLTIDTAVFPVREEAQKLADCIQEELLSFSNLRQAEKKYDFEVVIA